MKFSMRKLPPCIFVVLMPLIVAGSFALSLLTTGCFRGHDPLSGIPVESQVRLETSDGRMRTAALFIPQGGAPPEGRALVIMLHGLGASARNVIKATGWDRLAVREDFVAVFPNGTPKDESKPERFSGNPQTWNSGPGTSLAAAEGSAWAKEVPDVAFLAQLIEHVGSRTAIDRRRIYVAGHSNGAGMAYRFARERPELVASIGVMAGHLGEGLTELSSPVSLISICGEKDPIAPIDGGAAVPAQPLRHSRPMQLNSSDWARANGLPDSPRTLREDDAMRILQWGPGASGVEVRWIMLRRHGHAWPGGSEPLPEFIMGPKADSLNATETIWKFFKEHPKAR